MNLRDKDKGSNNDVTKGEYQREMLSGSNDNRTAKNSGDMQGSAANSKNDDNLAVLNDVYQNSVMGKQSISNIMPKIDDTEFKKELMNSYENYEDIGSQSSSELMKMGDRPREKNPLSKAMLWGSINIATLVDSSSSNIANMVIKGCNNSINNMTRTLNQHSDNIDEKVKNLAGHYINTERQNIENLQKFL